MKNINANKHLRSTHLTLIRELDFFESRIIFKFSSLFLNQLQSEGYGANNSVIFIFLDDLLQNQFPNIKVINQFFLVGQTR